MLIRGNKLSTSPQRPYTWTQRVPTEHIKKTTYRRYTSISILQQ